MEVPQRRGELRDDLQGLALGQATRRRQGLLQRGSGAEGEGSKRVPATDLAKVGVEHGKDRLHVAVLACPLQQTKYRHLPRRRPRQRERRLRTRGGATARGLQPPGKLDGEGFAAGGLLHHDGGGGDAGGGGALQVEAGYLEHGSVRGGGGLGALSGPTWARWR